jgi:hypothetical protein
MTAREALLDWLDQMPLIDHHVHGALRSAPTRAAFDNAINEADTDPLRLRAPSLVCAPARPAPPCRPHGIPGPP